MNTLEAGKVIDLTTPRVPGATRPGSDEAPSGAAAAFALLATMAAGLGVLAGALLL
jgi:hypothetical protein